MVSGFVWFNDLNTDHHARTANVADNRIAFRHLVQLAFQPFALCSHFASDVLVFQDLQRRQTGCHRQLVATEGAGVVTWCPCIELLFDTQHSQWQTATNGFRHHDDVWLNASVFEREEFTGTGKACLNFVQDQQNAVFLSHFTDALQPLNRSRVHAAFTLNGFQDYRSRFTHAAFNVVDQVFEVVGQRFHARFTADTQWATVLVWVRHELHFWHHTVYRFFRRQVTGHGQCTVSHTVVTTREADDTATAGDFFRQLQRRFHGVSTGWTGELQAVLFALTRQQREQVFGKRVFQRRSQIQSM